MPVDSLLISAAVVSVFVIFADVWIWGEFQSGPMRQNLSDSTESAAASDHAHAGRTGLRAR